MKSHTDFVMSKAFALMLIGTPKSGKTSMALCFPDPYILDCDNNLAGALRYHGWEKKQFKYWFDDPNEINDPAKRWQFCMNSIIEAIKHPEVKSIIVDGLSLLGYYLEKHLLANSSKGNGMDDLIIAGEKVMNMSHWNPFKNLMSQFVMACKSSGKLFIMTCHEATEVNKTGSIVGYKPLISGSLRDNINGFFSDVWRCETTTTPKGADYSVRFKPKSLMQIGNSLNIPVTDMKTTDKSRAQVWAELSKYLNLPADLVQ